MDGEPSERVRLQPRRPAHGPSWPSIDKSFVEADRLARLSPGPRHGDRAFLSRRAHGRRSRARRPRANPSTHQRTLIGRLDERRAALRATTETQKAVNAYTLDLKKRADRFSAEFLEPLNGLIDDFNRTLLSTPGETVQFSADAAVNRTDLGMRLRYADEVDNSRYDTGLTPQLGAERGPARS